MSTASLAPLCFCKVLKYQRTLCQYVIEISSEPKLCRRAKAAFEAYQEREMPNVKEEKPGLKQSQYKEMIWKSWQKAPENPFNKSKQ